MNDVPFSKTDIEANFGSRDLQRGRSYWRDGSVRDLAISEDGLCLKAKVRGTQTRPYSVTVNIAPLSVRVKTRASNFLFTTECSCPVGVDCKHAAAVCYEALAQKSKAKPLGTPTNTTRVASAERTAQEEKIRQLIRSFSPALQDRIEPPAPAPKKAPDVVDKWLDDLAKDEHTNFKEPYNGLVLYLLEVPTPKNYDRPHLVVRPMTTRILKNGEYGAMHDCPTHKLTSAYDRHVTPEDNIIGRLMNGDGYGYSTSFRSPPADPNVTDLLLRRVLGTGRCFLHQALSERLVLGEEREGRLGWSTEKDGTQMPAILAHEDPTRVLILPSARPWYVDVVTRQAGPLGFAVPLSLVRKFLEGPKILPDAVTGLAERLAGRKLIDVIVPPRVTKVENRDSVMPTPCLRLVAPAIESEGVRDSDDEIPTPPLAVLFYDYEGAKVGRRNPSLEVQRRQENSLIVIKRQEEKEAEAVNHLLKELGFVLFPFGFFQSDVPQGCLSFMFPAGISRALWLDFLHREVPDLRAKGWRIDVDEGFGERFKAIEADEGDGAWEADLKEQEGGAWWFSLDLGIMVEGQRVPLLPLLVQALRRLPEPSKAAIEGLALSGKLYVDLPDGRALALPFERVRAILTTLVELYDQPLNPDGTMNVPLDLATALARIDAATKMRWLGGARLKKLVERLKNFSGLSEIAPPKGLQATLRPYQREGLNWLQFLRDYNLGGILADDMGLGKTVQTLAHILVEKDANRLDRPCLIICPTSLIPNWEDEAQKFAPGLKILSLHGKDRATRYGAIEKADVVLTTYPLLPRDSEILLPLEWHMVVLDEAQAIKNPATKATQLVCEIKTRHRLCLTGTPIENHLGEAWSHFAFLMPGMLGTHKDFTKRFRTPIEKQKDSERQALLARRLKPFILRRNKSEVAKELPPKTEIIHHVEFESAQRDLYETLRLTMHEKVQQAVSEKGFNRSRIVILDALLKLRQACCDPRLVKLSGAKKVHQSAKLESLLEMLPEMIEEGRRILLFSQFTSMLDLIKPELDKLALPFVEIRGDTTDRKTPVTRFQSGEVPIFLISLKAGGTGLNLTAADTVIHFDPWWNPAVENQATDRAHRIGQNKPVFVYKFIAKGTVEERILDLQNRKRGLASALLEERPDATAAFVADDLDFLFQSADGE